MLTLAASSIYSYVFLGSLAVWGVCKYYQAPITLLELICIYGYAMFIFIPISVVCVIPLDGLKWGLSAVAFLCSGLFIVVNVWPSVSQANRGLAVILTGVMLACHLGMTLLFKFFFFTYKNVQIDL
jgi:hypothetical protein